MPVICNRRPAGRTPAGGQGQGCSPVHGHQQLHAEVGLACREACSHSQCCSCCSLLLPQAWTTAFPSLWLASWCAFFPDVATTPAGPPFPHQLPHKPAGRLLPRRCGVCQIGLKGEKEAVEHAKATGHTNFSEY